MRAIAQQFIDSFTLVSLALVHALFVVRQSSPRRQKQSHVFRIRHPDHDEGRPGQPVQGSSQTEPLHSNRDTTQVAEFGGPEVLRLNNVPVPTPKEDEVLIKVQWS